LTSALTSAGYVLVDRLTDAEVVILNTCSVREHAEARVMSHLGHLKHIKKSRPQVVVAVAGCMAQRLGHDLLRHPAVDIVCGPGQLHRLPEMIEAVLGRQEFPGGPVAVAEHIRRIPSTDCLRSFDDFERLYDTGEADTPAQAYVRAMHGCNRFCSYCVVPYVRGPEFSRSPEAIRDQIQRLADRGIRQITLLGQTINSYYYTQGDRNWRLADLLEMAAAIDGIRRVRFITSYPAGFDDTILRTMAGIEKVCPYLHIPAQSGSDRVLRAMNRHYTAAEYLALIEKARSIVPGIAIAGDFIVGFPGETEEDFNATCDLLLRSRYKTAFIFKYSPRPGTHADKALQDDVPLEVKKRRNMTLLALQNSVSEELNKSFLGATVEVMVEGPASRPRNDDPQGDLPQLTGRTATDHIVVFRGKPDLAGTFVKVNITRSSPLTLFGQLVAG
jgi:tRNA-2-methylthio-N6-dimethylallyladenosine synthase